MAAVTSFDQTIQKTVASVPRGSVLPVSEWVESESVMARLNRKNVARTHEGARAAANLTAYQELRRTVLSCLLWEKQFYESGVDIADRVLALAEKVEPQLVASLAVEARNQMNLRHVPLLLIVALCKTATSQPRVIRDTVVRCVKRADDATELLALYHRNGKRPLQNQLKRGLAEAIANFDEYQLAKYNNGAIRPRTILNATHPRPQDGKQRALWGRVIADKLAVPDTWEVALLRGDDKRKTFERLLRQRKLGYMALLRNLRKMAEVGVDDELVRDAILARRGADRVLPFRYVAAARAAPQFEPVLDQALSEAISAMPVLPGKTGVLVDVSYSMYDRLSKRSDMKRMDAAAALAALIHGNVRMFSFSNKVVEVPARTGMAGVDAIIDSQIHQGTYLGKAVERLNGLTLDRIIVITDEQSHDRVPDPVAERAYMINVASYQHGVGYGKWTHIDGFSESIFRFIHETEGLSYDARAVA